MKTVISQQGDEMTPLYLSARTTGTAGLSTVWPNACGWSWDETRSPTAGNGSCTVGGLSVRAPTDLLASHQLTSTPRLWASVRLTRTIDSSRVDSDPTQSPINSTG